LKYIRNIKGTACNCMEFLVLLPANIIRQSALMTWCRQLIMGCFNFIHFRPFLKSIFINEILKLHIFSTMIIIITKIIINIVLTVFLVCENTLLMVKIASKKLGHEIWQLIAGDPPANERLRMPYYYPLRQDQLFQWKLDEVNL